MIYDFHFDRTSHLLLVRWFRLFAPDDVDVYAQEFMRGFISSHFTSGYRLMMDMTPCGAQPQETVERFTEHMKKIPKASRIAVVATAPLLRGQVRRVMTQPYMRLFETPASARSWVLAA